MALGGIDTGAGLLTINNSGAAAQAAAFVGSGGLSKLGAGTLTLSQANTYTGTTTVSGGILNVSGSLASTGSLVVSGGTLDLQTKNQQFAGVQQTSGTIQNGTVTLNAGNYDLQGGTVSAALAGSAGANVTVGTTTLSGTTANTFAGLTTVSSGTLNLNKTAGVDAVAGNLTMSSGAVTLQAANQINNAANVVVSGGTLTLGANDETVNGLQQTGGSLSGSTGTLSSTTAFDMRGGTADAILGGTAGLTASVGTSTLSKANTYTGTTTVSGGILNVSGSLARHGQPGGERRDAGPADEKPAVCRRAADQRDDPERDGDAERGELRPAGRHGERGALAGSAGGQRHGGHHHAVGHDGPTPLPG
jgi:fibronectin-binding autotransporter adhesin